MLSRLRRFIPFRMLMTAGPTFAALWTIAEPLGGFGIVALETLGLGAYVALGLVSVGIACTVELFRTRLRDVTVCQFHRSLGYLPLYVAQRRGFFTKNGLRVRIVEGHGDEPVWVAVARGDAQFGISDPVGMIRNHLTAGVVVGTVLGKLAMWGMARKPMLPIRSMDRFHNKKTSVFSEPTTQHALIRGALEAAGSSLEDHLVEHSSGSEIGALLDDDVDIVLMDEPRATIAEREGAFRVFSAPKVVGPFLCSGCFTSKKFAVENSDIVEAFVSSLQLALDLIHADHLSALQVAREEFPEIDRTKRELATLRMLDDEVFPASIAVEEGAWQAAVRTWFPETWREYEYLDYVDPKYASMAVAQVKNVER